MRCSPHHTNWVPHPVIAHFRRLARWLPEDDAGTRPEFTLPWSGRARIAGPNTLQKQLMARPDRLPKLAALAQFSAMPGRGFAYQMIASNPSRAKPLTAGLNNAKPLLDGLAQLRGCGATAAHIGQTQPTNTLENYRPPEGSEARTHPTQFQRLAPKPDAPPEAMRRPPSRAHHPRSDAISRGPCAAR
jgi:hypothetical protein